MKHKHYEMIVAWADGAEIEVDAGDGNWILVEPPLWFAADTYRIKTAPCPQWQQDLIDAAKAGKVVEFEYADANAGWGESDLNKRLDLYNFGDATQDQYRIRPEKVTRYLWAIKDFAGDWCTTNVFRTEQEAAVSYTALEYTKLDYTATEFEE